MATREQLKLAREKALLSSDIGKRGKGKKTLEREAKRKILEDKMSEYWDEITDALIERSQTDFKALKYAIDQGIGQPTKHIDVKSDREGFGGIVILPAKNDDTLMEQDSKK